MQGIDQKTGLPNTLSGLNEMIAQQNQIRGEEEGYVPVKEIVPGTVEDDKKLKPEDLGFEIDKKGRIKYLDEDRKEGENKMPSQAEIKAYFNSLSPREKVKRGYASEYKTGITKPSLKIRKNKKRKKKQTGKKIQKKK